MPSSEDHKDLERYLKEGRVEEEKVKMGGIVSKYKGEKSEVRTQRVFKTSLRDFSPKVIVTGYKREQFCNFFKTGRAGCDNHEKNQEFDIVVLLAQCRVFLVIEVKNSDRFSEKDLKNIKRTFER